MVAVMWLSVAALGGAAAAALSTFLKMRGAAAARTAELRQLERLVERRAEQVTALSHELRTPLSMIKGSVDLLREGTPGPLTAAQERLLQVADHQSTQVIGLCESLLIQAKIEAGLFTPRMEKVDVSVVVRDVVTAMRPLCAQRGQRVGLDVPQVMPRIPADPMLLTQALTNLLSNASRFTTTGGSIDVRVALIDTGVAVYVTDDGAGMTREERHRLFHRFATGRPLADGTGLGLVITKTVVELHGGEIMVHTASSRGTTFLLTLPDAA
ncbi:MULTISPECIES: sensor histidine kinase [Streptomyces]|uniref:histidine kinase n=1 Tax=Streptomyces caniscabiei TaxID=2746961 RepID=A0ABU4MKH5_9ACTN|nr:MULTISPECIES: HAMP domain-containing sensor histidine kinase [Streptomyces]MBE4738532.1 HAMP domain-containing histidine kinase [Streptomyces caniscabiei]MBE4756671.1 HAMP domain-containing histidine kinase [Streptomyces caniscabiei]MBE4768824.1 HAMP domain-containing histidine kinase [Streptomyces caniscabiei]MBE4783042.1 HAMP domain-containing histidine kinase [Streptomyces caniscabiei]MBE4792346.1 HAMP domain-containing histidine kinase [Streptomyces caniscabiei]